jgi:iron complex outermembrane receptor protein
MTHLFRALVSLGALVSATAPIQAQTQTQPQNQPQTQATLAPVTITGNPLGTADLIVPVSQYSGTELLLRAQTTLGETLDGTPGISSTYFGPNASRPIIRGLDGDRIRILNNGAALLDVSSLSYDHAVTAEPLSTERIEVLRGPGALQFGGSAVGGVVNVIDNRIAREAFYDAAGGINGKANLNLASANAEKSGGLMLEAGNDRYALHADVFKRNTSDVGVPIELPCTKPGSASLAGRICNSASTSDGVAVGGSVFFKQGFLGASLSELNSHYGTVAEDEVTIGMKSHRLAVAGELRDLTGLVQSVKAHVGRSIYAHTEYEGDTAGTLFKSSGTDLRLEARHARWGALDGLVGLQVERSNFSAEGDEAFAPFSQTRQTALFAYEELGTSWGKLSAGARLESVKVQSLGNPDVARFSTGSRRFSPGSLALGALWNTSPGWQLTSNLAYTERAPKDYELYADGPHLATHAYEVGNANFSKEQSSNWDVGLNWKQGAHRWMVSAYATHFKNYIAQEATGYNRDAEGNGQGGVGVTDCGDGTSVESGCAASMLAEYAYIQTRARFTGLESSGTLRLLDSANTLDLQLRADLIRAVNLTTGETLPRIAPARLGATLLWAQGPWSARWGVSYSAAQTRVPNGQTGTDATTLWNSAVSYRTKVASVETLWFVRLDNMTDALAYSPTSVLTQTAPGKVPLPGRSVKLGLQASF